MANQFKRSRALAGLSCRCFTLDDYELWLQEKSTLDKLKNRAELANKAAYEAAKKAQVKKCSKGSKNKKKKKNKPTKVKVAKTKEQKVYELFNKDRLNYDPQSKVRLVVR